MIVPPSLPVPARPMHCPTAAHHPLRWASDGSNAATCDLPPVARAARGYVAATDTAAQAAARCCRDRIWSWHAPLDGLSTGHWAHRSAAPPLLGRSAGMPSLPAWFAGIGAEVAKREADAYAHAQKGARA